MINYINWWLNWKGDNDMIIKTKCGEIEGVFEEKQYVFKGIPYAESPVGSLRFKKPQPKKPNTPSL